MTEAELRAQFPEIVASIENAAATSAVAAERARLQDIEAIEAQIGDAELIKNAKYGENPCDAAHLALEAMKKQAAQGAAFVANLADDAKQSKTGEVTGKPNGGNADEGADDQAEFDGMINAYKKITGGKR